MIGNKSFKTQYVAAWSACELEECSLGCRSDSDGRIHQQTIFSGGGKLIPPPIFKREWYFLIHCEAENWSTVLATIVMFHFARDIRIMARWHILRRQVARRIAHCERNKKKTPANIFFQFQRTVKLWLDDLFLWDRISCCISFFKGHESWLHD